MFSAYREQYFEGGVSSVYLWDLEGGFAGCFLIKKGELARGGACAKNRIRPPRVAIESTREGLSSLVSPAEGDVSRTSFALFV